LGIGASNGKKAGSTYSGKKYMAKFSRWIIIDIIVFVTLLIECIFKLAPIASTDKPHKFYYHYKINVIMGLSNILKFKYIFYNKSYRLLINLL